jgi:hypothetical protein
MIRWIFESGEYIIACNNDAFGGLVLAGCSDIETPELQPDIVRRREFVGGLGKDGVNP